MTATTQGRRGLLVCGAFIVILGGVGLRIAAATTNLWHDEVWSLWLLHGVRSPTEILTAVHHDNNHPVNSLFLYVIGERGSWLVYRLLSIAAGGGAIRGMAAGRLTIRGMAARSSVVHGFRR